MISTAAPLVSIEVPVFKGRFLAACIRSVLAQTCANWRLRLAWDGGDEYAKRLLRRVEARKHPRISVSFGENRGIAQTRRLLTESSTGDYILPLDDDDVLAPHAIERLVEEAGRRPWAGILRARRGFIDTSGAVVDEPEVFPFRPRSYEYGLVTDPWNFTQPYLVRRAAYDRTDGWTGFADFFGAGEDCALSLAVEEVAPIELVDEVLYFYRLSGERTSHRIGRDGAFEMWRRLADAAISRTGLPVRRTNDAPPFRYERLPQAPLTPGDVHFVIAAASGAEPRAVEWRRSLETWAPSAALTLATGATLGAAWESGVATVRRRVAALVDARVDPGSARILDDLIRCFNARPTDVLGTRIAGEDGRERFARCSFDEAGAPVFVGASTRSPGGEACWLGPGLLLVSSAVLRAAGGVNGALPAWLSSLDLCLRARRRGLACFEFEGDPVALSAPVESFRAPAWAEYARRWQATPGLLRSSGA